MAGHDTESVFYGIRNFLWQCPNWTHEEHAHEHCEDLMHLMSWTIRRPWTVSRNGNPDSVLDPFIFWVPIYVFVVIKGSDWATRLLYSIRRIVVAPTLLELTSMYHRVPMLSYVAWLVFGGSLHGIAPAIQCKSPKSPLNQDTHTSNHMLRAAKAAPRVPLGP